jgi:hypothetical protein
MTWTVTDHPIDAQQHLIHVQAMLDVNTQQDEIRDLIIALEKRLTKENQNDRPAPADVR